MSDPEQFVMFHEIMELRETVVDVGWLDVPLAVVISVVLAVLIHLLVWVWYRCKHWNDTEMLTLARVLSVTLAVILVLSALLIQVDVGEYEMLCETYRTLYGPLPWEV